MSKKKLTSKARAEFALSKAVNALKWVVVSGVATYALMELQKLVGGSESLRDYSPILMMAINISLFAIAKYREGEDK